MGISSARDFLEAWYGDRFVCNLVEADFTLGGAQTRIAQQDPAVIARSITNNGISVAFISSRSTVNQNLGIPLAAGTTLNLFVLEDFDLASCDLWAISITGANPIHVISIQIMGRRD
jgi:hypothetical protein